MEKKQVKVESQVTVSGLTITTVTEIITCGWQNKGRLGFLGLKRPLYVLISDKQAALKVFNITGEESSLEQIVSSCPELRDGIKRVAKRQPF